MYQSFVFFIAILSSFSAISQAPKTYTSSEILLQLKKLNVLGSVLYIAAHPDDENTRLLAYLANEKMYRTGYLSLTRGDGGQNLIGDEQGIDLGLIRTQELLSARRIDGAEQFFSRAYDFGFCKTSEEALQTWGHDKILSDVVWVIRKFKPDVIIVRFPEDSRAGHGHHAASAILAREAFDAAADVTKFPGQLAQGVTAWQSRRLLWNTFNFGNSNTQSEDQFKLDVGAYNPLLGKGYGEIASLSRSQHKSQGFGVAAQRGTAIEYFSTVKGDKPVNDLMDGVDITWKRTANDNVPAMQAQMLSQQIDTLINRFSLMEPQRSVAGLVKQYEVVKNMPDSYWKMTKLKELQNCIEAASGLFLDATTNSQFAVIGDSIKIAITANNRNGLNIPNIDAHFGDTYYVLGEPKKNVNLSYVKSIYIDPKTKYSQPYWLDKPMDPGSFNVADQQQIGMAENESFPVSFLATIEGTTFTFDKQVRYKYTDPVKGELYQPVSIIPVADLKFEKNVYLFKENDSTHVDLSIVPNIDVAGNIQVKAITEYGLGKESTKSLSLQNLSKDKAIPEEIELLKNNGTASSATIHASLTVLDKNATTSKSYRRTINYDHIPSIVYQKEATTKAVKIDIKTDGRLVGYIEGAGDKIPEVLIELGYKVVMLNQADIRTNNLKQFDAIITGVRAYNTNEWMNKVYDVLMQYVNEGGILITQYNTSNQIGPVRARIAPYPFSISRNRVTDENAKVNFLLPGHPVLNYPNKITEKDFEGWIQERSIYNAEKIDSNYQRVLSMQDPGEPDQDGSLIIANYGKGRFVYTGLVFFRELPAGVPGAYRLFANLIAAPAAITKANNKDKKGRSK